MPWWVLWSAKRMLACVMCNLVFPPFRSYGTSKSQMLDLAAQGLGLLRKFGSAITGALLLAVLLSCRSLIVLQLSVQGGVQGSSRSQAAYQTH